MQSSEIIEGNKLIAEFMGWSKSPYENTPNKMYKGVNSSHVDSFIYHSSWEWLMPVVEKIESLGAIGDTSEMKGAYKLYIDPWYMDFSNYSEEETKQVVIINRSDYSNLLQPIYELVINFIKWYNQTTKP